MVNLILTEAIAQKSIHNTSIFPNTITFRTVLRIDTSATAIPTIKVADCNVGFIITVAVFNQCICDFVSLASFAIAVCAKFFIYTGSTTITPIKRTMIIVVEIMAIPIPDQCSELTFYISR